MSLTTEFNVREAEIPGLLYISFNLVADPRGWFQEKYQKNKLVQKGFPSDFEVVQHNLSFNKHKGVTRGFHAEPWSKYISVVNGIIYTVFVDLRKDNFGKKTELLIDNTKAVFIPPGIANSFQTLENETCYTYLVNDHWSENDTGQYRYVNLADKYLNVNWPIPLSKAIISDRDKKHPMLFEVRPFEFK